MNSVLYWNAVLLEVSRRDFTRGFVNGKNPGPIGTSRAMAMVHIAIREAIALPTAPAKSYYASGSAPRALTFPGLPAADPARSGYIDDIISGAANALLTKLYPGSEDYVVAATWFASSTAFQQGKAIGDAVFKERELDGAYFKPPATAPGSTEPGMSVPIAGAQPMDPKYGDHRADPFDTAQMQLGVRWGEVTRFSVNSGHAAMSAYPGAPLRASNAFLTDTHYAADYVQVRDLGRAGSGSRTPEQRVIGVYWGYDGANGLGVPPRLYNQIVRKFVADNHDGMTRAQCADLFAIINCAMADAGIDAWYYKYQHKLWRPVVGIRNEVVPSEADPFWAPLGAPQTNSSVGTKTPNFPAYPSGHATFGAAMYQAMRLYFGTAGGAPITTADVLKFDKKTPPGAQTGEEMFFVSDELDGRSIDPDGSVRTRLNRQIRSFAHGVWENAVSRVYLGVHWRFDGLPAKDSPTDKIGGVPLGLAVGIEAYDTFQSKLLAARP